MRARTVFGAAGLAAVLGIASAPSGAAPDESVQAQIESLRELVQRQQSQLDAQQDQLAAQEAPAVQLTGNRLTFTSADGRSSLAVRANVQLDMAHYDQDPAGPLDSDFRRGSIGTSSSRENDAARDLADGAYFRRARLGVEGTIARDFDYRFLAEFGGSGTEGPTRINDAYIAYRGLAPLTLQLGAFSPPANLADGTSTEDLLFIERSTPAELSRALGGADGRLGVGIRTGGSRWLGALTFTSRTVNDAETFDSQRALVGRLGGLVASASDYNVHLGLNGTYVLEPAQTSLAAGGRGIRFRDRPEIRVDSTRLVDTGTVAADGAYSAGVEFAANWKNFLLQGENFWYGIERRGSTPSDPEFGGYYVEASWSPTGERRRYVPTSAAFQAARPRIPFDGQGGWGAWELALRYSRTDLDFMEGLAATEAPAGSVRGGDQSIITAGINWYLNINFKLMFNYLHIDVDRLNPAGPDNPAPFGPSPATPPPGVEVGQSLDVYALRSQFSF